MTRTAIPAFILGAILMAPAAWGQSGTIEEIHIQGLGRMTREAFLHAMELREGDTYDVPQLRNKFRQLWDLALFDDITIEAEDGKQGGKILVIKVQERPVLSAITYEENKVLNRTQIEDRLREKEVKLRLGRPLDMGIIADARGEIRDMLAEKGFLDARVDAEIRDVTKTSKAVNFVIRPGGKTRIQKITFKGNSIFGDRKLKQQLKLTEPRKWYWPWSGKNLYHPFKWDQDVSNIRDLYQNHGYLDVVIGAPVLDIREIEDKPAKEKKRSKKKAVRKKASKKVTDESVWQELSPRKQEKLARKRARQEERARKREAKQREKSEPKVKKRAFLTVPIEEGEQYTTGEITVEGNEVLEDSAILAMVPLRQGMVLRNGLLEMGIENITRRYEDRGHLYATAVRTIKRRDGETIADVEITVEEDEPYYVSTIEFSGNSATKDRVLRREVLLNEGDLFNRTKLDYSKMKINQLGYIEVKDDPVIEPVEGENRVNVTFSGQEKGRNEIQVGGGYSGYDGAFFTGVYSTRNFLGRGQILSTSVQLGGRTNRYMISFQEPWFMNRPYALGFSLFRRDYDYGSSLQSSSKGGGIILGKQLTNFSNLRLSYSYESVSSTFGLDTADEAESTNKISSLTPIYTYNKINNPYRPSAGQQLSLSLQVAGGPLGGDTSFLKPILRYTGYRRGPWRTFLAFHGEVGQIRVWQDGSPVNSSTVNQIPKYQRFWLGGDTLGPRVFDVRTITPRAYARYDSSGVIVEYVREITSGDPITDYYPRTTTPIPVEVGGDRFFLLQSELVFPLNQQVELAMFIDAGDSFWEDQSWGFDTTRVSTGVELRFHLPVFPVPLRLIYGWPIRKTEFDQTSGFTFSIGRSF